MPFSSASPHAAVFEESLAQLMGYRVADRFATERPSRAAIPAATDHAEREPSQGVAADPSVLDTDAESVNSDGVEDARIMRLARWQAQFPLGVR